MAKPGTLFFLETRVVAGATATRRGRPYAVGNGHNLVVVNLASRMDGSNDTAVRIHKIQPEVVLRIRNGGRIEAEPGSCSFIDRTEIVGVLRMSNRIAS